MAYRRQNEMVKMSCGHRVNRSAIIDAIRSMLSSKNNHLIQCPEQFCFQSWDLDECANKLNMSDEQYEIYAMEIERRSSPDTKQCPFCRRDCEEPAASLDGYKYRVYCSCYRQWCWLCQQQWRTKNNKDCGNSKCELNVMNNKFLHNDDIKMKEPKEVNSSKNQLNDANNLGDSSDGSSASDDDCNEERDDDYKNNTKNNTKKDKNKRKGKDSKKSKDLKKDKNNKKDKSMKRKGNNKKKDPNQTLIKMGNGLVGLSNLGNTCFMNSALQCLLQCPDFVDDFFYDKVTLPTTKSYMRKVTDKSSTSYIWSQFIKEIYTTNYRSTSPRDIKNALNRLNPVIGNGTQEDAFCVIETLLQGLDDELCINQEGIDKEIDVFNKDDIPSPQKIEKIKKTLWSLYTNKSNGDCPIVRQLFEGIECEILTCPDCNYQCRAFQTFRHIELPLCDKNIKIKITVCIPEISQFKTKLLDLELAFDNTSNGLKHIVLSHINNELISNKMSKEDVNVKFGYIHPINNNQNNNDVNKWIKFIDDNGNCSKIKNYSLLFAVVYRNNNGDIYAKDNNNNNPKNMKFQFMPTFNLVVTETDSWAQNIIDTITFTKIPSSCDMVSGKDFINNTSKIPNPGLEEYKEPLIYYNNHLVTDDANHRIKITKTGCLLRIWIHPGYQKESPANVKINMDSNDKDIIQRALQQKSSSTSRGISMDYIMDTVYHYYTKLTYFDLSGFIPGYNTNDNQEQEQKIKNDKSRAESVYNKLKQLSDSEKLANEWLSDRINGIKNKNEKHGINDTKPKMLDNVAECLEVYEMKETSDGNGIECKNCNDCPDIASREIDIIQTPKILTIHIDREQADFMSNNSRRKRDNLIKYPITDLQFSSSIYDLFGVVEHSGFGTDWGHYVCYVKSLKNKNWYKMNDSNVSKVNHSRNVITKDASVLLYRKTSKN